VNPTTPIKTSRTANMSINKSTESLEQPLSTPTKDQKEVEKEKSTVTIFEVATEIETMLNEIVCRVSLYISLFMIPIGVWTHDQLIYLEMATNTTRTTRSRRTVKKWTPSVSPYVYGIYYTTNTPAVDKINTRLDKIESKIRSSQ
jgi:hypothetical protein